MTKIKYNVDSYPGEDVRKKLLPEVKDKLKDIQDIFDSSEELFKKIKTTIIKSINNSIPKI